ncbi:hypothetical protein GZ77_07350 [Endozoicomonas montiporae]|uniref:Toprim domain-containing protein n=2 Tax=Endozoicomonas montiporae TaxID=1027273 RepID=A0A081N707_9GAMM|nr:toprim domain-containing protein [Endozoicomonas montiporae]AMO55959.1 hypothetical protein EZMO1_1816 [Endozoicomonas montiporae CL-33]KEQ14230.1 hypothetical protein GZ77_07350 [Endozoicomonas montiporae]
MDYKEIQADEIVQALLNDSRFDFEDKGEYLRKGKCPNPKCGKKMLFVRKKQPWNVKCSREGNCQYEETTRNLLPELFENYSKRFPKTEENPQATADAYLSQNRHFDLARIRSWYSQEAWRNPETGEYCDTIRFYLDEKKTRYWERLIDKTKGDGQKANFGGMRKKDGSIYKGDAWLPPGVSINRKDEVWIVEGIFHATALHHVGKKAAGAFSCNNFPENLIKENKGKGITWILALDNEPGGLRYTKKHVEKLKKMGESFKVALTPPESESGDWDDLYRVKKLDDKFFDLCFHSGHMFMAESPEDKAYYHHLRTKMRKFVLDYRSAIYGFTVGSDVDDALSGKKNKKKDEDEEAIKLDSEEGKEAFIDNVELDQICNCKPDFLYQQVDDILGERRYVFNFDYSNGSPSELVEFKGSVLESPSSFNKGLLLDSSGGSFDGNARQLKFLRDGWLNRRMKRVTSLPFLGYDRDVNAWIFQDHAFQNGKKLNLNKQGYFDLPDKGIKTSLKSVRIHTGGEHKTDWILDFLTAFHWQGLSLLAFFLGSLFVQQIRKQQKSWPFMEYTGDPGAGKSTVLEFCWSLLGREDYEGFDLNDATPAGLRRTFSNVSNMPVVLIESERTAPDYKDTAKKGGVDFERFKKLYNGRGTGTLGVARRNNEVEEHLFQASLIISQNNEVDGSDALLQRIVHCHVDKKHHRPGTKDIASRLASMPTEELSGFLDEALRNEAKILDKYFKAFAECEDRFANNGNLKDERVIKCHSQIAAMGYALQILFPALTDQHVQMLEAYLFERAHSREDRLADDHPLVQSFWDQYEFINHTKYNGMEEGIYDDFVNHSKNPDLIAINFEHFKKIADMHRQERLDFRELRKLLPNSQRYAFKGKHVAVDSRLMGRTTKCWVFTKERKR